MKQVHDCLDLKAKQYIEIGKGLTVCIATASTPQNYRTSSGFSENIKEIDAGPVFRLLFNLSEGQSKYQAQSEG